MQESEDEEELSARKKARGPARGKKAAKETEPEEAPPSSVTRPQSVKNQSSSARAPAKEASASKPARKPREKAAAVAEPEPSVEPTLTRAEKAAAAKETKAAEKAEKAEKPKPKATTSKNPSKPSSSENDKPRPKQRIIREPPPTRSPSPSAAGARRSRRAHIAPLAFWKNEKIVYTLDAPGSKSAVKMPKISEIVRVESPPSPSRKRTKPSKPKPIAGQKRTRNGLLKLGDDEKEAANEDPGDLDNWELPTAKSGAQGVMSALVRPYPVSEGEEGEVEEVEMELAFSKDRIVGVEVANKDFTFVKTHSCETGGTGCITIPPGGGKRSKNSGGMFLVFFVHAGRATVVVNGNRFRVGRGGQFMVPRGMLLRAESERGEGFLSG